MPVSPLAATISEPAPVRRTLTHIVVTNDLSGIRSDWERLLAHAPASAYQTPAWTMAWLATRGRAVTPLFVVGQDDLGPIALLPLGLARRGGLTVARFLGGRDSNFGLGLFHPDVPWDTKAIRRLLRAAASHAGIDLFVLENQPGAFGGVPNPLAQLPGQPSASLQHETALLPDGEAQLAATLSPRRRKHIRHKSTKLASLGSVRHEVAADQAAAKRIAAALVTQRAARFGPSGDDAALETFLADAGTPRIGAPATVELHALRCADTIVAAFAGAGHARRFSGMLISFADDDPWARFSPGELLLSRIVAAKCRDGFTRFDLGIGEARYKAAFCPTSVPLFDTVLAETLAGRLGAATWRLALWGKRKVKQSPMLWSAVLRMRERQRPNGSRPSAEP